MVATKRCECGILSKIVSWRRALREGERAMRNLRTVWVAGTVLAVGLIASLVGCTNTPVDTSNYAEGPAPLRIQSPGREAEECESYEDSLTGGQVFKMYCSYCHNAPNLAERPYAQFRNVAAHMRVRANLTGKEYAKLMEFLRRWNDVPPPTPRTEPTPKRLTFSQPIAELRPQEPGKDLKPLDGKAPEQVPAPKPADLKLPDQAPPAKPADLKLPDQAPPPKP
jgi:hypothetical protein